MLPGGFRRAAVLLFSRGQAYYSAIQTTKAFDREARSLPAYTLPFDSFIPRTNGPLGAPLPALQQPGDQKAVFIETYGCQMNSNDTEILLGILAQHGFTRAKDPAGANVILLNTCAIREKAEQKILCRLGELKALKARTDKRTPLCVGVIGCMAERLKTTLFESKAVDIVAGPDALRSLPALINLFTQRHIEGWDGENSELIDVQLSTEETYADVRPVRELGAVSAAVSIMRGCNNMCSFCIVPFTRGRERSRPMASILDEVRQLYEEGCREVLLLGQNVNSYADMSSTERAASGREASTVHYAEGFSSVYKLRREGAVTFAELLERVAAAVPEMRIRFTSPHPKDFSDDVLQVIASHNNICKNLHMPAQSGSSRVLSQMKRGYTREAYDALIQRARAFMPQIALSTDIIVGFCGEDEDDHQQTLDLLRTVGYDQAFLFAYSKRNKTYAARHLQDDVPQAVKLRRLNEAISMYKEVLLARNQAQVSSRHLVMIEGPSRRSPSVLTGRTCTGKRVFLADDCVCPSYGPSEAKEGKAAVRMRPGDYVAVEIVSATASALQAQSLGLSSIAGFVALHGSTVVDPLTAPLPCMRPRQQ
ncbi:CDK5 regulatory subunit-associated protein 1 [Coccomyxa sp. Obi]|nr:CDK5 regulatory subunit-associated protein 1 [Coccomyxa sp. Obi]